MKNESKIPHWKSAKTAKPEAGKVVPSTGRLFRRTRQNGRRKGHPQEQAPACACGTAADGFLRHRFMPLFEGNGDSTYQKHIESGTFASLHILNSRYGLDCLDLSGTAYPYNVLLAHWHAERQVKRQNGDFELYLVSDDRDEVKFATKQVAERTYSLYYIPVLPLARILRSGKDREGAQLLLCIFSYLYHIADIPYYRDEGSYLYYHYEMTNEWITDDMGELEEEKQHEFINALKSAAWYGDEVERKIFGRYHLDHFAGIVKNARCRTPFELACRDLAEQTFSLWSDYPQANIFSHLRTPEQDRRRDDDDDDEYYNTIHVGEYIHFIADTQSSLYDSIQMNIDSELNEKLYWQEHTLFLPYDQNFKAGSDSLDYENRLFKLLDQLCYLLNDLP